MDIYRSRTFGKALAIAAMLLSYPGAVAADGTSVAVYSDGRGGFSITGNNLNRIVGGEIRIDYDGEGVWEVKAAGGGGGNKVEASGAAPGTFTIRFASSKPASGRALLAMARVPGRVVFSTAWLRNDRGGVESPPVSVRNPTEEESEAIAGRRRGAEEMGRSVAGGEQLPEIVVDRRSQVGGASDIAPVTVVSDREKGEVIYHIERRWSVLERFRSHAGERDAAALSLLFAREDDIFLQEPRVVLSDGEASLLLRIDTAGMESPRFFIAGASCTECWNTGNGEWILKLVPARGRISATVTVVSGDRGIEFPLAVAPPIKLYAAGEDEVEAEYVAVANRVVGSLRLP